MNNDSVHQANNGGAKEEPIAKEGSDSEAKPDNAKGQPKSEQPPKAKTIEVPGFLLDPFLVAGESRSAYDALLDALVASIAPADLDEVLMVKDIADFIWEIRRLHRMRAQFIDAVRDEAIGEGLGRAKLASLGVHDVDFSAKEPVQLSAGARATLEEIKVAFDKVVAGTISLEEAEKLVTTNALPLDMKVVTARAFVAAIGRLKEVDALVANLERRRDAVRREIERRREVAAERARKGLNDLVRTQAILKFDLKKAAATDDTQKQKPPGQGSASKSNH